MALLQVISALFVAWLSIASAYPAEVLPTEVVPAEVDPDVVYNGTLAKRYNDGEGHYIATDAVHHGLFGSKCWVDWYVVSNKIEYSPWYQASNKVFCSGTSMCQVAKMTGTQNCETWSIKVELGIQSEMFKFGVSLGYDLQKCKSASDTTSCTWNDRKCHVIWAQQQYLVQRGYQRQRCHRAFTKPGNDYTVSMTEFVHKAPTSSLNYGCGSKCSDSP